MIRALKVRDYFETYTWCYFYIDEKTKHGFLIDPGAEADSILDVIRENEWTIEKILLTHGHFDHTAAVEVVSRQLRVPYFIHTEGKKYLESTHYNLSRYCERNVILNHAKFFRDGDEICLQSNPDYKLKVIHTPGHTEDSVIFYSEEEHAAFTGDTIFSGSVGNTEYPGGNRTQLQSSIAKKIFTLPKETILYPGHSDSTTVGMEMARYGIGG